MIPPRQEELPGLLGPAQGGELLHPVQGGRVLGLEVRGHGRRRRDRKRAREEGGAQEPHHATARRAITVSSHSSR